MSTNVTSEKLLENLISLQTRMDRILPMAPKILRQFVTKVDDAFVGFADQQPNPMKRNSVTCAAQCIRVILQCECLSELTDSFEDESARKFFDDYEWKTAGIKEHNIYTTPLVLIALRKLGIKRSESQKIDTAISFIFQVFRQFLREGRRQSKGVDCGHAFIVFWAVYALKRYEKELRIHEKRLLRNVIDYARNSLFRQLAFYVAGDDSEFDVVQLAYFLATATLSSESINMIIIEKAMRIVLACQQRDGTWKLSKPFLHGQEGAVMTCFSVEVPTALLVIPCPEAIIVEHLGKFSNTLNWVERNVIKTDEGYIGWQSDSHFPSKIPESWSSALVYEFLDALSSAVQECIQDLTLRELGGKIVTPRFKWEKIYDFKGFKKSIETKIIEPVTRNQNAVFQKSAVLLFGPPGTGKDSIIYALADRLGNWPTVTLHSTNFTINGPDQIISCSKKIFDKLLLLEHVVVFFNEIDELVVAREIEAEKLGRSITNSMLPWFEQLKTKGRVIFVVATNHVERFDKAIRRRGRFDLVLPVGPPETKEKIIIDMYPDLTEDYARKIASEMDRRITISEIAEFCDWLKNSKIVDKRRKLKLVREKIREINDHAEIDLTTMKNFEESLKLARY